VDATPSGVKLSVSADKDVPEREDLVSEDVDADYLSKISSRRKIPISIPTSISQASSIFPANSIFQVSSISIASLILMKILIWLLMIRILIAKRLFPFTFKNVFFFCGSKPVESVCVSNQRRYRLMFSLTDPLNF